MFVLSTKFLIIFEIKAKLKYWPNKRLFYFYDENFDTTNCTNQEQKFQIQNSQKNVTRKPAFFSVSHVQLRET